MTAEETKQALSKAADAMIQKSTISSKDLLSSGSTLLNLACSGMPHGAFLKGHFYWFVGDSSSGKTFLALTCLAEATRNKNFQNYRIIYDNSENGALMNIEKFFGSTVANKLEPPSGTKDNPRYSETLEDMYFSLMDAIDKGTPFIFIEDSLDVLDTEADAKKAKELRQAKLKNKELAGSYGMAKAKVNSENMRRVISGLRKTNSIMIAISQTRDNVGFGATFEPKRASGGRSLKFYATLEIWSSVKESIKKVVRGKSRQLGIISKVRVKKNRLVGRDRTVEIPIYHSYGIDDISSCINFLIDEDHWTGTEKKVKAPEFDYDGTKDGLIELIEEQSRQDELIAIATKVWNDIEKSCEIKRRPRYT